MVPLFPTLSGQWMKPRRPPVLDTCQPQPPPVHGKDSVTDAVIEDLQKRREGGLVKYGMELQTWNGRSFLVDAYQELLDAALYIRGELMEQGDRSLALQKLRSAIHILLHVHSVADKHREWLRDAILLVDQAVKDLTPPPPRPPSSAPGAS